jgi:quercetin dioxygenase-like cupin family protein
VRVLRIREAASGIEASSGFLPHREAREKGPSDVIPASAFWLTRASKGQEPDPASLGAHLVVVLSGEVRVAAEGRDSAVLGAGDVLCADVRSRGVLDLDWDGHAWLFFVLTPGWLPEPGDNHAGQDGVRRAGRPLLTWIYDDDGSSRSEPFRWPAALAPVPPTERWPESRGAFVTRRDYGDGGHVRGVWHNGPRPQLGLTLNGCAENETGDGTVTRPVAGDVAYIDDVTGAGHVTRGRGDRWMLFVTVAPGHLRFTPES